MGVRHWLMMITMVIGAALLLAACNSPGEPFEYRDLKVSLGPASAPAQPAIGQTSIISFTLRNTWSKPVTAVKWRLHDTTNPMSVVMVDEDDTVAIAAFDRVTIDVALPALLAGKRTTYEVVVDPDNTQAEDDETNNTSTTLTVVTANQDIAFGTPIAAITWPTTPNTVDQPTLNFTINYTINPAVTPPGSAIMVPYTITVQNDPDDTPVAVVPITPTPPSPATVNPLGTIPLPVTVTLPATGSNTFIYTITLSPADGDDGNLDNNTATVTVVVPAPG